MLLKRSYNVLFGHKDEPALRERHTGKTIAIVIADSRMKYLSTDLWER